MSNSCDDCKLVLRCNTMQCPVWIESQLDPVGIMPRQMWMISRLNDIKSAMLRYNKANKKVPLDWIVEYYALEGSCKQEEE